MRLETGLLGCLGLGLGLGLACQAKDAAPPSDAEARSASALDEPLVDPRLLAELLGEAVGIEGDRVIADGLVVRLAFEPLIRQTGPASIQLVQGQGYRLSGVSEGSPLWQLGLREGDVLTAVDGKPIMGGENELRSLWTSRPARAELAYLRGDEARLAKLTIEPGPAWPTSDRSRLTDPVEPRLPEPVEPAEPVEPDAATTLAEGLRCVEGSPPEIARCELRRDTLDALMRSPELLATQARLVPLVQDGESRGFRLYGMRTPSFVTQLGFKNGDLVTSINDHPFGTLDAAVQAYTALRDATSFTVVLERRDETLQIVVEVVP